MHALNGKYHLANYKYIVTACITVAKLSSYLLSVCADMGLRDTVCLGKLRIAK